MAVGISIKAFLNSTGRLAIPNQTCVLHEISIAFGLDDVDGIA